jgi:hypothetical protein
MSEVFTFYNPCQTCGNDDFGAKRNNLDALVGHSESGAE